MTGEAPSLTAQRVAMRRAAHQLFDDPPVFEDALAIAILGEEAAAKLNNPGALGHKAALARNPFLDFLVRSARTQRDLCLPG